MRKTILALTTLVALIFVSVPFAAAEWQESMVTNNTLEEIYVIKSTWHAADDNKNIPTGFRTRGSYRIPPGKSRIFHSWDTNSIYFRISNAEHAIKANSGTAAFAFCLGSSESLLSRRLTDARYLYGFRCARSVSP